MGNEYLYPKQNKNKQPTSAPQYHQHNKGGSQFYWPHNQTLQTGGSYHRLPHSNQRESSVQQVSSNHRRVLDNSGQSFERNTASAPHSYALLNTNPLSSGSNSNTALIHRPFGSSHSQTSGDFQSLGGTPSNGYASASHGTDPSSFGVWQGSSQQQSNHKPVRVPTDNAVNQPPVVNGKASGAKELDSGEYIMLTAKLKTCLRNYQHNGESCVGVHIGEWPRRDTLEYNYSYVRCKNIEETRRCQQGKECPNAHGAYEFGFHPMIYRTRHCRNSRNNCSYGQSCFYAHSEDELRKPMEQLQIYAAQHGLQIPVGSYPQPSAASETADNSPPGSTLRCAMCGGGITILRWNILRQFQHNTNHAYMPCGHSCHRDCLEETMKRNVGVLLPCNRCTKVFKLASREC